MRHYDPNPGLSAFAVVIGAAVGIALAVLLGLSALGVLLLALVGVALAGVVASSLGLIGERNRGGAADDDLPSHYHDY